MKTLTKIMLIAVLLAFSNCVSFGQGLGASQKPEARPENFEHLDCGFRYPYPGKATQTTSIGYSTYRELGEGMIHQYWSSLTRYDIGCIDLDDAPRKMKKDELISLLNSTTKAYLQDSPEFVSLPAASVSGKEIYEFETKTEYRRRVKYILEGNRVLIFLAGAYGEGGIEEALKLFKSVEHFSLRETVEKKLAAATQKSLPQTPAVKLSQTDAAFNNLKGRVKTVRREAEDVPVLVGTAERRLIDDETYDRAGNLLKDFWFQNSGYPTSVSIYGFIDGARVSDSEYMGSEESYGRIIGLQDGAQLPTPKPTPDPRYESRYVYRYDASKRLTEKKEYDNQGELSAVYTFTYQSDLMEEKRFNPDGKLVSTKRRKLDKNGNVLKYEFWWYEETDKEEETYEYKKFDRIGNWTERRVVKKIIDRGLNRTRTSDEFRAITYHAK